MKLHMQTLYFLITLCLAGRASELAVPDSQKTIPILTSVSRLLLPSAKIEERGIIQMDALDLVVAYQNLEEESRLLLFNFNETHYLGKLELSGIILGLGFDDSSLIIDVQSLSYAERLTYKILRHTEHLSNKQEKQIYKIASEIQWAILEGLERPLALLPPQEYEIVQNMPPAIRKQLLQLVGKRWLLRKVASCLF